MLNKKDPLRISQESLDLDDIISDLNSEKTTNLQPTTKPAVLTQRTTGKEETQKNLNNGGASKIKQGAQMSTKQGKNKENDPGLLNKQTNQSDAVSKGKLTVQQNENSLKNENLTTVETKAGTSATGFSENGTHNVLGNQRYGDSNIKSFDNQASVMHEEHETVMQMPFYLKGAQQLTQDEDVESFQRKLDTLIVNFRSETMSEFMKTKKQVLSDQAQTIDAERRRCNTLLGVKQNEIEQLKENLGQSTKRCEELNIRCEGMAFWSGKSKMMLRIKLLQHRAFDALKKYRDFKKHSKKVLEHRLRQYRENLKRDVFQGWGRQYKEWKIVKNREDFDKAVKLELQHICAQYNKEIESLRERLNDAQSIVENEHRNKAMMQENLKKAFMRGVCALNFEAMNILNPNDQNYQQQIEREMEKQVINAMNSVAQQSPFTYDTTTQQRVNIPVRPPIFQSASDHSLSPSSTSFEQEVAYQERKMMQQESAQVNPFTQNIIDSANDFKKIESKDSQWKPAPIMGREITQHIVPSFTYQQPSITSQLKPTNNVVLSSTFNKLSGNTTQTYNSDLVQIMTKNNPTENPMMVKLEEDTSDKRLIPGNPATIIQGSSSLPDFVSGGHGQNHGEGKVINATSSTQGSSIQHTKGKVVGVTSSSSVVNGKKLTSTVAPGSAISKKK